MTRNLLDLSGKIDPATVEIYDAIVTAANTINARFFVVGATARDLILNYGYGIRVIRATTDIDLGVQLGSDWSEFEDLKRALLDTGNFIDTKAAQRLLYQDGVPVDIVPFGSVTDRNGNISWPPDHSIKMCVLGFDEAYESAQRVRLRTDPLLEILVASLAGLAVLKLIAWSERSASGKDALDLMLLLRDYLDAGNQNRLMDEHANLLADDDFDYVRAGARLLGRHVGALASPQTRKTLLEILKHETGERPHYRLAEAMMRGFGLHCWKPSRSVWKRRNRHLNELMALIKAPKV